MKGAPPASEVEGMAWMGGYAGSGTRDGVILPRSHERYQTHGISCHLGEVMDLSGAGMKVSCRGKPPVSRGDVLEFSLRSGGQRLAILGRVAWTRRLSWREHRFGVQFINVRPSLADALVQFAQHGFVSGQKTGPNFTMGAPPQAGRKSVRAVVEVEDLYRILGVKRDADPQAIRAAYRAAARVHHPDVSHDPDAEKKFGLISKAYSVLNDPDARRRYDDLLRQSTAA